MPLDPCQHRVILDPDTFSCRHSHVHSRAGQVDADVCGLCEHGSCDAPAGVATELTPTVGRPSRGRLIAIPAASLDRDPSGVHKSAYIRLLAQAFGGELLFLKDEDALCAEVERRKPDLLVTMNLPWYDRFSDRSFWRLPRQLPLVTVHDDCRRQMHPQLEAVLERSDAVISPVSSPVLDSNQFPQVAHKLFCVPYFIPSSIVPYPIRERPIKKCLLTGAVSPSYPLRLHALRTVSPEFLERLRHPGYGKKVGPQALAGQPYFDRLHEYLCGITCGSIYGCVVAKYFEIAYTGSLLLAENLPDLVRLGFAPAEHFIAIDGETNLTTLIGRIANEPEAYLQVRRAGQELVQRRHTEAARLADARRVVRQILAVLGTS